MAPSRLNLCRLLFGLLLRSKVEGTGQLSSNGVRDAAGRTRGSREEARVKEFSRGNAKQLHLVVSNRGIEDIVRPNTVPSNHVVGDVANLENGGVWAPSSQSSVGDHEGVARDLWDEPMCSRGWKFNGKECKRICPRGWKSNGKKCKKQTRPRPAARPCAKGQRNRGKGCRGSRPRPRPFPTDSFEEVTTASGDSTGSDHGSEVMTKGSSDSSDRKPNRGDGFEVDTEDSSDEPTASRREDFDISECESYQLAWLVDLAESCEFEDLASFEGCNCRNAQRLRRRGQIECSDNCPQNCDVCDICLGLVCGRPISPARNRVALP